MSGSSMAPLGVLEEQILVAVLRTRDDAFGMSVRREIKRVTGRDLAIGAVYATLDRLEAKGLLTSRRAGGGASRRTFEVSPAGIRALAETKAMRERLWRGVDRKIARALTMFISIVALLHAAALPAAGQTRTCSSNAGYAFPRGSWERIQPAQSGWSVEELEAAKQYATALGSQAWLLVENGKVVDSYGPVDRNNSLHSARKSVMSAMYGQAIADGRIDKSKTLRDLSINDTNPSLSPEEQQATIRDLLMARSGVYHVAQGEAPGMVAARPQRFSHPHGTFWYYNNWDFNALGTIFSQQTGKSLFDFLAERIAIPLGMEDFKRADQRFFDQGQSIHKYYNFELSTRDMARFGHLFLSQGCWGGREIVPAAWVKESTTPYSNTIGDFLPRGLGFYGYMWWVAAENRFLPNMTLPNGSFAAIGAGPQVILVVPQRGLVLVHQTGTDSICPFDRTDCNYRLLPDAKVFTLLQMIIDAKRR